MASIQLDCKLIYNFIAMPTIEERIKNRIKDLKSLEMYFYSDNRSTDFFRGNPENTDELIINEKISAINNGLIDVSYAPELAQHIMSIPVDEAIKNKDLTIVDKMARFTDAEPSMNMKHFCSLYCNFHDHAVFPIQSPTALELITLLQEKSENPEHHDLDLKNYDDFRKGLDIVMERYDLKEMNYYEVDKFFWINETRIKDFIATL